MGSEQKYSNSPRKIAESVAELNRKLYADTGHGLSQYKTWTNSRMEILMLEKRGSLGQSAKEGDVVREALREFSRYCEPSAGERRDNNSAIILRGFQAWSIVHMMQYPEEYPVSFRESFKDEDFARELLHNALIADVHSDPKVHLLEKLPPEHKVNQYLDFDARLMEEISIPDSIK